jgi:hypothetical protein
VNAHKHLVASLGLSLLLVALMVPATAQGSFGIKSLVATARNSDGTVDVQAGSHPYEYTVSLGLNLHSDPQETPEGSLRDLVVDLPPGMVGNPLAVPRCAGADFEGITPNCPGSTQIGVAHVRTEGLFSTDPVYNLTPPPGVAASIGFAVGSLDSFQEATLRTGGDYGISVSDITIPNIEIQSISETIWGVPPDAKHNGERQCIDPESGLFFSPCSSEVTPIPFLSLPTSCTGPLKTTLRVDSFEQPGVFQSKSVESLGEGGTPEGLNNCEALPFNPTITVQPEATASDSPTGLHVNLHIPQSKDPNGLATANLKDTVVTLPKGMSLNPSAAGGLGACSPEQIDLHGPGPANCPDNSKVGTVSVETPLLDHSLPGAVYIARQGDNPFDSLLALYIAVNDPDAGVVVKLAGNVEPDPQTGQLKATFKENPQLPFEDFDLDFFGGPRGSLTTPPTCGTYTTTSDLTPWTSPEGKDVFPSDSFEVGSGPGGGACPNTEAQMPNKPSFEAGTASVLAGDYSPFLFKLSRENGSQRIGSVNATLPPGLTGKLAGLAECSDAQIAQAASRNKEGQGAIEQQSPSCPASSKIGTVTVGAGSGAPFYVQGNAYLAGPYKGAPISFAFITPAVAGPFDLGTVEVRAPAYVNPSTAQITVKSDPIPQILDGIPLDIRSIAVSADRNQFTLNPTSCDPMAIGANAISTLNQGASLSNRFQVGGCRGLGFEPKIALRLRGGARRGAFPRLHAVYTPKPGDANLSDLVLRFPRSEFVEQGHFRTICTRVQFAANACPSASVYGHVKAITPLLDKPLEGPAYLRSSNHNLPDLVFALHGQVDAQAVVRIDSVKGGLRASLEDAPDVPLTKVILDMQGGQRGLLVNSRNVCAKAYRASAQLTAHSGKEFEEKPVVRSDCGRKHKRHRG